MVTEIYSDEHKGEPDGGQDLTPEQTDPSKNEVVDTTFNEGVKAVRWDASVAWEEGAGQYVLEFPSLSGLTSDEVNALPDDQKRDYKLDSHDLDSPTITGRLYLGRNVQFAKEVLTKVKQVDRLSDHQAFRAAQEFVKTNNPQ